MMAGIKNVSYVDWCLHSNTAPLFSPWGRCSMPVTRYWMPSSGRALCTQIDSQARAMRYSDVPRAPNNEPSTMARV